LRKRGTCLVPATEVAQKLGYPFEKIVIKKIVNRSFTLEEFLEK
jgi:predicted phosphoribosyltransferase